MIPDSEADYEQHHGSWDHINQRTKDQHAKVGGFQKQRRKY